jgi:hypothetical protein
MIGFIIGLPVRFVRCVIGIVFGFIWSTIRAVASLLALVAVLAAACLLANIEEFSTVVDAVETVG